MIEHEDAARRLAHVLSNVEPLKAAERCPKNFLIHLKIRALGATLRRRCPPVQTR